MRIHIFGSSAGGGLPQWNCSCLNCRLSRESSPSVTPRTQSSIGISENGKEWVLINASPDIRTQLAGLADLWPTGQTGPRETKLKSILLTDAQLDHTLGLLILREGRTLNIHCTSRVEKELTENFPVFRILQSYCGVEIFPIPLDGIPFFPGGLKNIEVTAIPLWAKAPPYSPERENPQPGDGIALKITNQLNGRTLIYAPNLFELTEVLLDEIRKCHVLLMDGTFWDENELPQLNIGHKKASSMGHRHLGGEGGLLEALTPFSQCRKILIHINNTNPVLHRNSPQRAILEKLSFEVGYDGMDLVL